MYVQERHKGEVMEFQEKVAVQMQSVRPKFSKELLNIRRIQETLAKQKEYAEAHKTKMKADLMVYTSVLSLRHESTMLVRIA